MGYGDDIMLTAKAKSIYEKTGTKMKPVSGQQLVWSVIYDNNPYMSKEGTPYSIQPRPYSDGFYMNPIGRFHKLKQLNPKPGNLHFTEKEVKKAKTLLNIDNFVTIEPNSKQTVYANNKEWGLHKWQTVVDSQPDVNWVQLVQKDSPKLKNVHHIQTDLRTAFCIIGLAKFHVSIEGGTVHAAIAQNVKSVCVFGGLSAPYVTGYKINSNIYVEHTLSSCGSQYSCDHCKQCMELITTDYVINEVEKFKNEYNNF